MIQRYISQVSLLIKRLGIAYLLYFISRLTFFAHNRDQFPGVGWTDFLSDSFFGLRFDSFSIAASNSIFILLSLLPLRAFYSNGYQRLLLWLFAICNSVFLAANFIDVAYFAFTRKRSGADLFEQMGGQTDVIKLMPSILSDFWPVILLFACVVFLLVYLYKKITTPVHTVFQAATFKSGLMIALLFVLMCGFTTLALRGGWQRVPIDIVNAGSVTSPEEVPIVLNTPFTLIKSLNQQPVKELHYFETGELRRIYDPRHHYNDRSFQHLNVVVLILESFSKEYTRLAGKKDLTPFLDSLMDHSLLYTNGYSNGTKSIEGIPAILSSLPSLMENPFINSIYANNVQSSFATLLDAEGYESAFFHGGINGTMNFDDWAALAGYDHYYGRDEYMNDKDFDGYWGIWDEPFLQYSVKKMNEMRQPFHTAVFTLSSHHPYFIPTEYKQHIKEGPLENSASIRYADLSLRRFFESAVKAPWYKNTLFVLVADHCGISEHPFFANPVGYLSIPILFYKPDNSLNGKITTSFSQIDILPQSLKLIGYNKPFFSFGNGFKNGSMNSCYFYAGGMHYVYTDSLTFCFRDNKLESAMNFKRDSILRTNIAGRYPEQDSLVTRQYKAFMQTYNNTLIRNAGSIK